MRKTWIALALALVAALSITLWRSSPLQAWGARRNRIALLAELQPVVLDNCDLKRFGAPNDGGYLLCDRLSEGIEAAYSYGVGPDDSFGCAVSRRYGVTVHQYDCFDPARPTCEGGDFVFHKECIGPRPQLAALPHFDTMENQLAKNLHTGKRVVVKIDIEGAEWESLLATPDAVLDQIDQMPMEMHGVDQPRHLELVRRLKQKFHLVNLHFNNQSCSQDSSPLPGSAFQALWVNKRLGVVDATAPRPAPRSELNAPDDPSLPDCQLPSG